MKTVLLSQRDPKTLTKNERQLLEHFFGSNELNLEKTEIGSGDERGLAGLSDPIIFPVTMDIPWSGACLKSRGRDPLHALVVRLPDGFRMGLAVIP